MDRRPKHNQKPPGVVLKWSALQRRLQNCTAVVPLSLPTRHRCATVRYCALLCATVRYCALTSAPKPCMWYFIPSLLLLQLVIDSLQRHGRQLRVAGGDRV